MTYLSIYITAGISVLHLSIPVIVVHSRCSGIYQSISDDVRRERETETERDRERQRETERDRERHRETERQRDRDRERQRETERQRERLRETERDRDRERGRERLPSNLHLKLISLLGFFYFQLIICQT